MARLTRGFVIAALAFSALTASVRPAHPQTSQYTTDTGEADEEKVFHRLEALDAKRARYPKAISASEWQTAFLGNDNDDTPPRPQYLGTLFREYAKLNRQNQIHTIRWVETLADELVQRGDAKMFLLLATHYVKYNQPPSGIYSPFFGDRNTFGMGLQRLGKLLKTSLATLSPDEERDFKKDLAFAAAFNLVANVVNSSGHENPEPQNGFIAAVLGYELITSYARSDEAMAAFEAIVKTATFQAEDLQGFFTQEGVQDFMVVAGGFMPNMTLSHSPLSHIFNMGLRVDKEAGESMRNMFIAAIAKNKPEETLFAIDAIYRLAAEERYAGKDDTLAQQMLSPVWDEVVSTIMTPKMVKAILLKHYTGAPAKTPQTFHIARRKQFGGAQETEMQGVYVDLLRATAKTPQAYYNLVNSFSNVEAFRKALEQENTKLQSQNLLSHFSYLATIYREDVAVGSTIDSNLRMMHLMQLDGTLKPDQRVKTADFQRAFHALAQGAKTDGAKSYQLIKLLATANTSGWSVHITTPFIERLRKTLVIPRGSFAEDTLASILRVQADERARLKAWRPIIQINPPK